MTIFAAMAAAGATYAQAPQTEITVLKAAYTSIKTNITKAAERMPEDQYGFKASPDIRTFGALIGHIADVQSRICSVASGATPGTASAEKGEKLLSAISADVAEALSNDRLWSEPI